MKKIKSKKIFVRIACVVCMLSVMVSAMVIPSLAWSVGAGSGAITSGPSVSFPLLMRYFSNNSGDTKYYRPYITEDSPYYDETGSVLNPLFSSDDLYNPEDCFIRIVVKTKDGKYLFDRFFSLGTSNPQYGYYSVEGYYTYGSTNYDYHLSFDYFNTDNTEIYKFPYFVIFGFSLTNTDDILTGSDYLEQFNGSQINYDGSDYYVTDATLNFYVFPDILEYQEIIKENIASYNDTITQLDSDLTTYKSTVDSLNSSIKSKDSEIASLNSQVSNLNGQVSDLNNAIDDWVTEVNNLNASNTRLEGQVSSLTTQVNSQSAQISEKDSTINSQNTQITQLQAQVKDLEANASLNTEEYRQALATIEEQKQIILGKDEVISSNNALFRLFDGIGSGTSSIIRTFADFSFAGITLGTVFAFVGIVIFVMIILKFVRR